MVLAGAIGYSLAAAAFAALAVLLAVGWEGRGPGIRLVVASAVTAGWSALLAFGLFRGSESFIVVFFAESARLASWLLLLAGLVQTAGFPSRLARASYVASLAVPLAGLACLSLGPPAFKSVALAGPLLLAITGLVLLEQVYRNSNASGRWALKFLYMGLGGILVYDVFLYSQAVLLKGLSPDAWMARGYVVALTVPLIALAARRNPSWSVNVFVSRHVVFYTTSFLAIGGYLLLMAAGGYAVRLLGGAWGLVIQIVFFSVAIALLVALVASAAVRRRLRVFLVKHFYRHKYEYREEWLRFIRTLAEGAEGEDVRVTAIRAVAQIIGSPGAALLQRTGARDDCTLAANWSLHGMATGQATLALRPDLLELLERRQWLVDLDEYRADPDAYDRIELPAWLLARRELRLVVPVLLHERLLGVLLLANPPGGFTLTFEDRDLLNTVARHIATHLAQHDAEQRLAEGRQFEAYSKLTAFLMHDLKNSVAQLQLVVTNARQHRRNPEFVDDAVATVDNTAQRIARLIEQLATGTVREQDRRLQLSDVVNGAVLRCSARAPEPSLELAADGVEVRANAERLGNVVEHLIRNAQDATPESGAVRVRVERRDGAAVISVADTGSGMSAEFVRDRLFRPFDSTKGSKGMGIGAYQAREYVRELGGDVEVQSEAGRGTVFQVILPCIAADAR